MSGGGGSQMSVGSLVSSSNVSSRVSSGRVCNHGSRVVVYTSWSKRNPSRRFYRCSSWKEDDCGYFEWLDEDFPQRQKDVMIQLVESKNVLEEKIDVLQKDYQMKEGHISKLEAQMEKFKMERKDQEAYKERLDKMKSELISLRILVVALLGCMLYNYIC